MRPASSKALDLLEVSSFIFARFLSKYLISWSNSSIVCCGSPYIHRYHLLLCSPCLQHVGLISSFNIYFAGYTVAAREYPAAVRAEIPVTHKTSLKHDLVSPPFSLTVQCGRLIVQYTATDLSQAPSRTQNASFVYSFHHMLH